MLPFYLNFHRAPPAYQNVVQILVYVTMVIFALELSLKLFTYGP